MDTKLRIKAILANRNRYYALSFEEICEILDLNKQLVNAILVEFYIKGNLLKANNLFYTEKMYGTSNK